MDIRQKSERNKVLEGLAKAARSIEEAAKVLQRMEYVPMKAILAKVPGHTIAEKAERCGVSRQAYYFWLDEVQRPSLQQAQKIAKLTGIPVEDIISNEEKEKQEIA
jgi:DNA-binding XRE family transcriptional regulator